MSNEFFGPEAQRIVLRCGQEAFSHYTRWPLLHLRWPGGCVCWSGRRVTRDCPKPGPFSGGSSLCLRDGSRNTRLEMACLRFMMAITSPLEIRRGGECPQPP